MVSLNKVILCQQRITRVPIHDVVTDSCAAIVSVFTPAERDTFNCGANSGQIDWLLRQAGSNYPNKLAVGAKANVILRSNLELVVVARHDTTLKVVDIHTESRGLKHLKVAALRPSIPVNLIVNDRSATDVFWLLPLEGHRRSSAVDLNEVYRR